MCRRSTAATPPVSPSPVATATSRPCLTRWCQGEIAPAWKIGQQRTPINEKGSAYREESARQDGAIRSAGRRSRQTQTVGRSLEPPVARPQTSACSKQDRRKQVSIEIANA